MLDSLNFGCFRGGTEDDAAMLQHRSAVAPLRTAANLGVCQQHVSFRTTLKAQERLRLGGWTARRRSLAKSGGYAPDGKCLEKRLVKRRVKRTGVGRKPIGNGYGDAVGQLAVVHNRSTAAGPPYCGAIPAGSVSLAVSEGLKIAQ